MFLNVDSIDWSVFLGRREAPVSEGLLDSVRGKRILVTGAGGSIGCALSKLLMQAGPSRLVLLDHSELGLYELGRELHHDATWSSVRLVIGSINDADLIDHLFVQERPQIIFHAAACKHVPLLESNPFAAALTNILGSRIIARAAAASGAEECILLSTDKAVEPTSIMGVTKRISECIFLSMSGGTAMKIVRLGNVLGSSGSVVPLFLDQIRRGESLTVADSEATRYFLTASEAVAYLIGAASPKVLPGLYIPVLEGPYGILDLAKFLMHQSGLKLGISDVILSGLRPGDKLAERMVGSDEFAECALTAYGLRKVSTESLTIEKVDRCLADTEAAVKDCSLTSLLQALRILVPEYLPSRLLQWPIGLDQESETL